MAINLSKEERVLLKKMVKEVGEFSKEEKELRRREGEVEYRLINLKVRLLRWFGSNIHLLLKQKGFRDVEVGFVYGYRTSKGIDTADRSYRTFQGIGNSIFTNDAPEYLRLRKYLQLRIDFSDPRSVVRAFCPFDKISLFKELKEEDINPEELLAMINNLSSDISLSALFLKSNQI